MTRAADKAVRDAAQHGGTVSTLMALALAEGIIDAAVLADQKENLLSESTAVSDSNSISARGKSKFVVSPTVAAFNEAAKGPSQAYRSGGHPLPGPGAGQDAEFSC